jgi:benzoyl-CoA reductase subunit B
MTTDTPKGLERFYKACETWRSLLRDLRGEPVDKQNRLLMGVLSLLLEKDEQTIQCAVEGKPFLSSWYASAPEIYAAMDLHYFNSVDNILQHLYANNLQDLEACDRMGIPEDICSLIRLSSYGVMAGAVPTPTAVIAMMQPCDGMRALHESYRNDEHWGSVPFFALDSVYSYNRNDAGRFRYFAGELKRMVAFLEAETGHTLDFDKLRDVIEETNRQFELWAEYNELRRAVPCPGPSFEGTSTFFILTQIIRSGDVRATELLRSLLADTEKKVRDRTGPVEKERIRIFWADIVPAWSEELSTWLAKEWGASIIMDWQSFAPYTAIDTATEESMLNGLARRALTETMMVRQSGPVEVILEDATRIINDYSIDCVVFPGHMGHKDQSGYIGFLREMCRDLRVPFLSFTSSLFDPRYMSMDDVKGTLAEFFSVHELGR